MNKTTENIPAQSFGAHMHYFFLDMYIAVGSLDLRADSCFAFLETTKMFSKLAVPFYTLIGVPVTLHPCQQLVVQSYSFMLFQCVRHGVSILFLLAIP